ncbi:hypothetical protein Pan241w_57870 [Gimesia alba]|uniref:Uncharacterized protein n=2 Tax=Gimesia alba TaxID=2527973 RepID=A0A517RP52_9PLAN|nr:hypothetical protein Pan241w_57870 [Gimesia alba]
MKNFTLAIAALAAVTLVSSTSFAATPFCGTSDYFNSRYNSRYNNHSARNYNRKYNDSVYHSRNYLNNSYRTTRPYDSLTNRLNSLYSNPWSNTPLFTDYTYRARTNYNTFSANSNRYNYDRHDRYDHGRYSHHNNWRYDR